MYVNSRKSGIRIIFIIFITETEGNVTNEGSENFKYRGKQRNQRSNFEKRKETVTGT